MTFAMEVKEEIVNLPFDDEEIKYFLSGFIKHNGEILITNNKVKLRISTLSSKIASSLFKWIKKILIGDIELSVIQEFKLNKSKIFTLTCQGKVEEMLNELKIYNKFNLWSDYNFEDIENKNLIRAFIAGSFVSSGSVNAPTTSNYHLEIQVKNEETAKLLKNLIAKCGLNFKDLKRKNKYILYLKKSLFVSDFLKLIGATTAVMNFEVVRIERDLNNSINRINNIDLSNHIKTVKTGESQINSINYIKEKGFFNSLSIKAQKVAEYRIKFPEHSYSELSIEMDKDYIFISKPGISNLLKKIKEMAKDLGERQNG